MNYKIKIIIFLICKILLILLMASIMIGGCSSFISSCIEEHNKNLIYQNNGIIIKINNIKEEGTILNNTFSEIQIKKVDMNNDDNNILLKLESQKKYFFENINLNHCILYIYDKNNNIKDKILKRNFKYNEFKAK